MGYIDLLDDQLASTGNTNYRAVTFPFFRYAALTVSHEGKKCNFLQYVHLTGTTCLPWTPCAINDEVVDGERVGSNLSFFICLYMFA